MWIGLPHYDSPQTSASLSALFIVQTCFTNHRTTVFSLLHPFSQIVVNTLIVDSNAMGTAHGPQSTRLPVCPTWSPKQHV